MLIGLGLKLLEKRSTPLPQVKLTKENSSNSPTPSSDIGISAISLENRLNRWEKLECVFLENSPQKFSLILIPTITNPSTTVKSKLDLRSSLNKMTTSLLMKIGLGLRKLEQELTQRPQVKLTRKNSTDSPTLLPDISISALKLNNTNESVPSKFLYHSDRVTRQILTLTCLTKNKSLSSISFHYITKLL